MFGSSQEIDVYPVTDLHWYKGRGLNAYRGANIVALTLPHLSRQFRDHYLGALFPHNPQARQDIFEHMQAAELLQMLHRSRQPECGVPKPLLVLGASEDQARRFLQPLLQTVDLQVYEPIGHLEKNIHSGRWIKAMTLLMLELLKLFPEGLTKPMLEALPGHSLNPCKPSRRTLQARERLHLLAKLLSPEQHLHQAVLDFETWRFGDAHLRGSGNDNQLTTP